MKISLNEFTDRIETVLPDIIKKNAEKLFLIAMSAFLVLFSCKKTQMYLPYPAHPSIFLLPLILLAVILRVMTCLRDHRRIIAGLSVMALYCVTFLLNRTQQSNYSNLVYLGLLTLGCIGIHYEKLLKVWCVVVGSILAVTFCAASVGAAENLVYYVGGWRHQIRGSLGIVYPTDCATWILFFLMMLWVACKRIPVWFMLMLAGGSALFSISYCDSTTTLICSLLFGIAVIYEIMERRLIIKHRITDIVIYLLSPISALFMFALVFLYGKGAWIAYKLDEKLHGRIGLGWDAVQKYGIRPFGFNFEMEGLGGKLVHDISKYNFLDSSYVNILVRYGIIIFFVVMAMWLYIEWKAAKTGDRRLLFVMAVISLHSFEEHHFMEAIYNPLIIMALADFIPDPCDDRKKETETSVKDRVYTWLRDNAGVLAGVSAAAIIIPTLHYCFSVMRTVADLTADPSGKPCMSVCLLLIIILLGVICALIYGVANVAKHITKRGIVFISVGIISAVITLIACDLYISARNETVKASLATEKGAIEHILRVNSHPVYIDTYPEIYRSEYPILRSSIFAGPDLARYGRATVITDTLTESDCFFNRGYLMTQLSDSTVVYSNDESVLTELEKAGWHITGYYSVSRKARIDDDGSVFIEGLAAGRYAFSVELKLISTGTDTVDRVGEIKVMTSEDANADGAEPLYTSDFSKGNAHKDIVCNLADSPEVRITVECTDGYEVRLVSADYAKSNEIDVHDHYNDDYQVVRSEYFDHEGNRIAGSDGASAFEYEYDDAGNVSVIRYYGIDDKPLIVGSGYAEIHKEYDDLRRVISESYYDVDGKPKTISFGQAADKRILDVKGNIIVQKYYGTDGKPVLLGSGYSEIHREFDDKGHVIREEYYDTKGNPCVLRDGYAAVRRTYDDNDNVIFTGYYNAEGNPTIVSLGYSEIHRKFDDTGNTLEESYYNTDGHLMMIKKGYAIIRWEYDSVGRVVKESYYDTQENPVALTSGQASDTREYDSMGNCVIQRYYSVEGAPAILVSGYAEIHRDYNEKGQLIREAYYDTSENRVALKAGYSSVEYEYDEYGNKTGEFYFDVLGNSVMINTGYSTIRRYYDEGKRLYREEYLGVNDEPVINTLGYHAFERKYDETDHVVREEYLDCQGYPVNCVQGYASLENTYDKEGHLATRKYRDNEGKPSADKVSMVSEIHYEYDPFGHIVREEYFGPNGNPAVNNQGYAAINNTYNEIGLVIERRYSSPDGSPIACTSGYAKITYEYDKSGLIVAEWYCDKYGEPVTCTGGYYGIIREYDERGKVSSQTMVDLGGMPMISTSLYARIDTEYDDYGRETVISYHDTVGEPVIINSGYASVQRTYDEWGRVAEEAYFGTDGKQMKSIGQIASLEREYDNNDLILRETYYDIDGKVTDNSSGVSEYRRTYGDTNLVVREELLNSSGNRQEIVGYDSIFFDYNNKGLNSRIRYTDNKGDSITLRDGYSMVEYGYDDGRNRVSDRYLDVSGHYVDNTSGYGGVIREYDGRVCVRESFINSKGSPVNSTAGYCTVKREYDDDRNLVSVYYLDMYDHPVINTNAGYSVVKYEYDEYRNRIGEFYYDTVGQPIIAANGYKCIKTVYDKDRKVIRQYQE